MGVLPEFGLLATSYMSDVPAFAAFITSLAIGDRALKRRSQLLLCASLAVGMWGVTIREQALVAPASVLLVAVMKWRGRSRLAAAGQGTALLVILAVFESWRRSLPLGDSPTLILDIHDACKTLLEAIVTLALFLLPPALLVARPRTWSLKARAGALAAALGVFLLTRVLDRPLGYNYIDPSGSYSASFLGTRTVVPPSVWILILVITSLSAGLLAGIFIEHGARWDRLTVIALILFGLGILGQAAVGQPPFGRYLIPVVPLLCGAVLATRVKPRRALGMIGLAIMLILGLTFTSNALSYDAARWHAASELQARGVPATDIDAGLEWLGWYSNFPARGGSGPQGMHGWTTLFQDTRACYVVSASRLPGATTVEERSYRTFALLGRSPFWVQKAPHC